MESALKNSKFMIKNWWLPIIIGALFILVGFWTISTPLASYLSLVVIFATFMFVSGIFQLIFSISNRKEIDDWGWHFAGAMFDFVVGAILFLNPGFTMAVLPFVLAFYFMFKGFGTIGFALDLKKYGSDSWGWLFFSGVLSIIFSIMIIFNPLLGGLTIVVYTAFAFFSLGFFYIALAFTLKKIKDKAGDVKEVFTNLKQKTS
jgi:uncharacterized membrane protein HdeD (DUF308 family)